MNDPGGVGGNQSLARGSEELDDLRCVSRCRGQPLTERLAVDQLHRDEHSALPHPNVVHGDHVGVRQSGERFGLAHRSRLRTVAMALHELHGDFAVQLIVERRVDDAHAAGADSLENRVPTDAHGIGIAEDSTEDLGVEPFGFQWPEQCVVDRTGVGKSPCGLSRLPRSAHSSLILEAHHDRVKPGGHGSGVARPRRGDSFAA